MKLRARRCHTRLAPARTTHDARSLLAFVMRGLCIAVLLHAGLAAAQVSDLGHRVPGAVGLDAGTQPDEGLYVAARVLRFASSQVNDRAGNAIPIAGLDIDALATAVGFSGTLRLHGVYLDAALSIPFVKLSLDSDRPEASVDRLGLGNVYVEPLKLGTRWSRVDAVAGYGFYIPTAQGARSGVGQPEWAHQFSAGSTVFFDDRRGSRASALVSFVINGQKRGVDITRGDMVLVQGGAGARVFRIVDVGVAGYALWQVTDDRGSELPPQLAGARDQVFGLGPELDVLVPPLRSRLTARFEWDIRAEARPLGTLLLVGITTIAAR